jgi:hypothetical protein
MATGKVPTKKEDSKQPLGPLLQVLQKRLTGMSIAEPMIRPTLTGSLTVDCYPTTIIGKNTNVSS